MRKRELRWIKPLPLLLLLCGLGAAGIVRYGSRGELRILNADSGALYAAYPVRPGERFSVGFIHSVNKSPLIDVYEIKADGIYVEETIYYDFGAGVETELAEGEQLHYGPDGAMIVSGFDRRITPLSYFVGTVSDHILELHGERISLRELCGRSSRVELRYQGNLPLLMKGKCGFVQKLLCIRCIARHRFCAFPAASSISCR